MSLYAHISDSTVDHVGALPKVGMLPDGRGVSGYDNLPAGTLKAAGWLPVVDEPPTYDADRRALTQTGYVVDGATVRVTYDVETLPPSLVADPLTIPADGSAPSVVTYTDPSADAPGSVSFDVNGAGDTEPLTGGVAQVEVVASGPGPITITCEGLTTIIIAEETP